MDSDVTLGGKRGLLKACMGSFCESKELDLTRLSNRNLRSCSSANEDDDDDISCSAADVSVPSLFLIIFRLTGSPA